MRMIVVFDVVCDVVCNVVCDVVWDVVCDVVCDVVYDGACDVVYDGVIGGEGVSFGNRQTDRWTDICTSWDWKPRLTDLMVTTTYKSPVFLFHLWYHSMTQI